MKQKIIIVLSGGGAKSLFQLGFLKTLKESPVFNAAFEITEVHGTSAGALCGASFLSDQLDVVKNYFMSYAEGNPLVPLIDLSWVPLVGKTKLFSNLSLYLSAIFGITNLGLFKKDVINNIIKEINLKHDNMNKFYCAVHDVDEGVPVMVNGRDKQINKYLAASMSIWAVFAPESIDGKLYVDGGLLSYYPFDGSLFPSRVRQDCKYLVIDMLVRENNGKAPYKIFKENNNNIIQLISTLVDASSSYLIYSQMDEFMENNDNIYHIKYPSDDSVVISYKEVDKQKFINTYNAGVDAAKKFIRDNC